jgi:hypothetical protein
MDYFPRYLTLKMHLFQHDNFQRITCPCLLQRSRTISHIFHLFVILWSYLLGYLHFLWPVIGFEVKYFISSRYTILQWTPASDFFRLQNQKMTHAHKRCPLILYFETAVVCVCYISIFEWRKKNKFMRQGIYTHKCMRLLKWTCLVSKVITFMLSSPL